MRDDENFGTNGTSIPAGSDRRDADAHGRRRALEDLRTFKSDIALTSLLQQDILPSTNAMGDWLRRTGSGDGMAGLFRLNQWVAAGKKTAHFNLQGQTRLHAHNRALG